MEGVSWGLNFDWIWTFGLIRVGLSWSWNGPLSVARLKRRVRLFDFSCKSSCTENSDWLWCNSYRSFFRKNKGHLENCTSLHNLHRSFPHLFISKRLDAMFFCLRHRRNLSLTSFTSFTRTRGSNSSQAHFRLGLTNEQLWPENQLGSMMSANVTSCTDSLAKQIQRLWCLMKCIVNTYLLCLLINLNKNTMQNSFVASSDSDSCCQGFIATASQLYGPGPQTTIEVDNLPNRRFAATRVQEDRTFSHLKSGADSKHWNYTGTSGRVISATTDTWQAKEQNTTLKRLFHQIQWNMLCSS